MKLGVFAVLFAKKPLEEALEYIASSGLQAVELGTGGFPDDAHCNPTELLADAGKFKAFQNIIDKSGLEISALSCHGNPLHPDKAVAKAYHDKFVDTVKLAERLGVQNVVTFSGCPGDSDAALRPNWVTCAWPDEFMDILKWQWEEKAIPYWTEQHKLLEQHNVRVAIEAHPGFLVYNTETMLRLRNQVGERIGVNFDPSHLFWQNMDPVACIKALGRENAIFHVHAKDVYLDPQNTPINGVLDSKSYRDEMNRSWIFRTVGYGHGEETWRNIISTLQLVGYEGVMSIEHEDSLMSVEEGFQKAAAFLKNQLIHERIGEIWWA